MINSVNSNPMVYQAQNVQGQQPMQSTNPAVAQNINNSNANLSGINALATYNQPMGQVNRRVLTPSEPIVLSPEQIKNLDGQKILDPNGELNSIVQQTENATVVYKMDVLNPDEITNIKYYDNATGKLVRVQDNHFCPATETSPEKTFINVDEIDINTGKVSKSTYFEDGKITDVCEVQHNPDGSEIHYGYSYIREESSISESDADCTHTKETTFDKNGKIKSVQTNNREDYTMQVVEYFNGIPAKIKTEKQEIIPNETGINPFADSRLVPMQPYVLGYDPHNVQGEKQYYSNGVVASIETHTAEGNITHNFTPNGDLEDIYDDRNGKHLTIMYDNFSDGVTQTVREDVADGLIKSTSFNPKGDVVVRYENKKDDSRLFAHYTKEGALSRYFQKDSDGKEMLLSFDKQGNLRSIS
jgi:hypothetical protein